MKTLGIALSGGGLRGTAHIGVLEALNYEGIKPQFIAGTSAGSIIASCYACGISPRQMKNTALNLKKKDYLDVDWKSMACSLFGISRGYYRLPDGLLIGDKIQSLVHELTAGKKLSEASIPLAITATDLDTGKRIVFTSIPMEIKDGDTFIISDAYISEAVRASISIPVVFRPYHKGSSQMVDGGLKEMVPVGLLKVMGAEYILGVDLQTGKFTHQVKELHEIVTRSIDIMIRETSLVEEQMYADMLIYPPVQEVGLGELNKVEECIRAGFREMKKNMSVLKRGLGHPVQ